MQSHEHDDGRTELDSSFNKILISNDTASTPPMPIGAPVLPPPSITPNPWADEQQPKLEMKSCSTPTILPPREETSVFSVAASSTSTDRPSEHINMPPKDVLREFDPLSDQQELDARDAWASSEGHPAPQGRNTPGGTPDRSRPASVDLSCNASAPSSRPSTPGLQPSTSSSASPFPSLTAIARSFSIPTVARPRSRPTSMDTAKPIAPPSPGTAASFAAQQQAPAQPAAPSPLSNEVPVQPVSQPAQEPPSAVLMSPDNGSEDETLRKEKEPSFDFQKFLDQMKSRGAEPVAKYLRS